MSGSRRYRVESRDANEPAIVAALQRWGFTVELLPGGDGRPDLLAIRPFEPEVVDTLRAMGLATVADSGWIVLIEVKNPAGGNASTEEYVPRSAFAPGGEFAGLTPGLRRKQAQWHQAWPSKVFVVTSPEDLAQQLGLDQP